MFNNAVVQRLACLRSFLLELRCRSFLLVSRSFLFERRWENVLLSSRGQQHFGSTSSLLAQFFVGVVVLLLEFPVGLS